MHLTFGNNGEFRRELRLADPVSGDAFPHAITEETFTTSEGRAHVTVTRVYLRQAARQ